jgi:predicted ATPase
MKNRGALQLVAYQVCHFKPFVDTGWLEIKPITLLFGHNSSGKSALLSVLPMLRQTLEDPNPKSPFVFSSETGVDLGTYDEVAYSHEVSLKTPIWFNLRVEPSQQVDANSFSIFSTRRYTKALDALGIEVGLIEIRIAAKYNKKRRRIAITDFILLDENGEQFFRTYRKTTAANQRWHVQPDVLDDPDIRFYWEHFLPRIGGPRSSETRPWFDLFSSLHAGLRRDLLRLVHLGPLRDSPRRAYRLTGESPQDVGQAGENWFSILLQARERGQLASQVNKWLDHLGHTLQIEWGRQGYVHPMLKDESGLRISLKDAGFGISQILPVLIQGFYSPPGTILILEQPEIHLHPRAQAELGDMLLAISQRGVRLLVETHSEHLLLRLRRRMAESQFPQDDALVLPEDDMAIYYVERLDGRSEVREVKVDRMGKFVDPPERFRSFFSEDYEETLRWSEAVARISEEEDDACGD